MLSKCQEDITGPQEIFSSPVLPLSLWSSAGKAFEEYGTYIVKIEKENLKALSWQQNCNVNQYVALVFVKARKPLGCLDSVAHCVGIGE